MEIPENGNLSGVEQLESTCHYSSGELWAKLEAIDYSPADFALFMRRFGDRRSKETILRGLRRMLSGETSVSGEVVVILELLDRLREVGARLFPPLTWTEKQSDCFFAEYEGWKVELNKIRRCWRPTVVNSNGFAYPWASYSHLTDLSAAKRVAEHRLFCAMEELV